MSRPDPRLCTEPTWETNRPAIAVNLERALKVGARLGGHFVQGHIDTTAVVRDRRQEGEWEFFAFGIEPVLDAPPGFQGIDRRRRSEPDVGRRLAPTCFSVMLIPHTLAMTTLGTTRPGDRVNIEVDILAKHVQKLLGK